MNLQPNTDGGFIITGGSASADGDLSSNNRNDNSILEEINLENFTSRIYYVKIKTE